MRFSVRAGAQIVIGLSLVLALAACSSTKTVAPPAPTTGDATLATAASNAIATSASAAALPKPCEILTLANAAQLVGAAAAQQPLSAATHRCEYENPSTNATISVGVDTYDPAIAIYGDAVTGLSADQALWAPSSSQLILVKGNLVLTIIAMSADPAEGSKALAIRAGGMVLANL
jgi:hypothetical protein